MYKQIKTVVQHNVATFDSHVNEYLANGEGWELTEYKLILTPSGDGYHYAHLERCVTGEVEKCCDNRKHCDKSVRQNPCCNCENASNWEKVTI